MQDDLIILMFHRVHDISQEFTIEKFEDYLRTLVEHFTIVLPGEKPDTKQPKLCLTFDDAYCDFYFYAYPLLKKYNVKTVLAVATDFILDSTELSPENRLSIPYPKGMQDNLWHTHAPFCTWPELKEMADSGLVMMASHSASHPHMTAPDTDLQREIVLSKQQLEAKLSRAINCFIYPYGNYNRRVHKMVRQHYAWDFRIGSALNKHWQQKGALYRVDAEKLWPQNKPFDTRLLRKLRWKYWVNQLRGK